MKKFRTCALMMALSIITIPAAMAQDEVETTVAADVVSQYIWRGQELGQISVQPTLGIAWKGLSLTAWGNVGLSNPGDTKEFDLTAAYAIAGFNVGVTDYWFNYPYERYFQYASHSTSHIFEANLGYDFGPVSVQWYTNFAGNDGQTKKEKRAYSSYFELNAPFKFASCDWKATVGAVPWATTSYLNANGFAFTNISLRATKELKITDTFAVPIFAAINTNPSTQKAYFVIGLTLQP